ncbi:hypothetical protein LPC08_16470 [Roseomonas sp. OT10]|uniref:hypothetical protein n=1 Tax=Roseomonas cutis TaxID=2897332 RepID=UPI001E3872BB|nr:hypothetical protein [Roseomonas sp. OT10]UFN47601.1 hypothetical protein LPC08_16470 [Roseomonas sp. OT10]
MPRRALPLLALLAGLAGCGTSYSPDTYATRAVQQANKAEQGVIVGVRKVEIRADGTTGAATGAAAGGLAGSTIGQGGVASSFAAIGGGLVGGLLGSATERAAGDSPATEYIVKKSNNELVSVVQVDAVPLSLGQKVLVIAGNQARIVPDYTVQDAAAGQPGSPAAQGNTAQGNAGGTSPPPGNAAGDSASPGGAGNPAPGTAAPAPPAVSTESLPAPAAGETAPPAATAPSSAPAPAHPPGQGTTTAI